MEVGSGIDCKQAYRDVFEEKYVLTLDYDDGSINLLKIIGLYTSMDEFQKKN